MSHGCGGVHVRNLFRWNAVVVAHADGTRAEYVHVARGSARVALGDDVAEGAHLADSGDVGDAARVGQGEAGHLGERSRTLIAGQIVDIGSGERQDGLTPVIITL